MNRMKWQRNLGELSKHDRVFLVILFTAFALICVITPIGLASAELKQEEPMGIAAMTDEASSTTASTEATTTGKQSEETTAGSTTTKERTTKRTTTTTTETTCTTATAEETTTVVTDVSEDPFEYEEYESEDYDLFYDEEYLEDDEFFEYEEDYQELDDSAYEDDEFVVVELAYTDSECEEEIAPQEECESQPEEQLEQAEQPDDGLIGSVHRVTQEEYYMLCNLVGREYGANWVSEQEKAKVVEVVFNRLYSSRFPNTIYKVLTQKNQFPGYLPQTYFTKKVTESVKTAVLNYLNGCYPSHGYLSYWGDGRWNHFR